MPRYRGSFPRSRYFMQTVSSLWPRVSTHTKSPAPIFSRGRAFSKLSQMTSFASGNRV